MDKIEKELASAKRSCVKQEDDPQNGLTGSQCLLQSGVKQLSETDVIPSSNLCKKDKNSCALLITTFNTIHQASLRDCCAPLTRKEMYTLIINWYLENTSLSIFVVDSNNIGFDIKNQRLSIYVFDQYDCWDSTLPPMSSSTTEILSIKKSFEYFDFTKFCYVFKLTGKYAIPNIEKVFEEIVSAEVKSDLILQFSQDEKNNHQNTEILGIKVSQYDIIMNKLLSYKFDKNIEYRIFDIINNSKIRYTRMNKLEILSDLVYARGDGTIATFL